MKLIKTVDYVSLQSYRIHSTDKPNKSNHTMLNNVKSMQLVGKLVSSPHRVRVNESARM
jgi:hypothetical protein